MAAARSLDVRCADEALQGFEAVGLAVGEHDLGDFTAQVRLMQMRVDEALALDHGAPIPADLVQASNRECWKPQENLAPSLCRRR